MTPSVPDGVIDVGNGLFNLRGSFKIAGVVDVGTQASLVELRSGDFVMLDACGLTDVQRRFVDQRTDGGRRVEAFLHLHPFHTLHVEAMARAYPGAKLYGTARHHDRLRSLAWEPLRTDDPALHARYAGDLAFTVPRGVDLVPERESVHFASVLALHRASRTIHVDDTLDGRDASARTRPRTHGTTRSRSRAPPSRRVGGRVFVVPFVVAGLVGAEVDQARLVGRAEDADRHQADAHRNDGSAGDGTGVRVAAIQPADLPRAWARCAGREQRCSRHEAAREQRGEDDDAGEAVQREREPARPRSLRARACVSDGATPRAPTEDGEQDRCAEDAQTEGRPQTEHDARESARGRQQRRERRDPGGRPEGTARPLRGPLVGRHGRAVGTEHLVVVSHLTEFILDELILARNAK